MNQPAKQLLIRKCSVQDAESIADIYRPHVESGTATFELSPPSVDQTAEKILLLTGASFPFIVGILAEELIGYAYAGPYRDRPAYRHTIENSVYIRDGFAGRGYGKQLLTALIREASLGEFRQMIAIIGDSGNVASVALHRSAGFSHVGMLKAVGYKRSRWLDTVIMQRSLTSASADGNEPSASETESR